MNISWRRIYAIVLRHEYNFLHNWDRLVDAFYWPAMDIIVWGLTSAWIAQLQSQVPNFVLVLLTGLVFWQIVWRGNYEISTNMLEEFWNQNLVNLFSSPLTIYEWMAAVMLLGFVKMFIALGFCAFLVWILYHLSIFTVGWMLIPFLAMLLMSGWFMGFLGSAFVIYWGQRVQTIAWTMGFLFAPFSAVYYPVSVLPKAVQHISYLLPTTYIFEGMRSILFTGHMPMDMLLKSFVLNCIYLAFSLWFFVFMFHKSQEKGLSRLE